MNSLAHSIDKPYRAPGKADEGFVARLMNVGIQVRQCRAPNIEPHEPDEIGGKIAKSLRVSVRFAGPTKPLAVNEGDDTGIRTLD